MADNPTLPATGQVVAADDIGGVLFPRMKLVHGADGTNDGDVSSANPLPVQVVSGGDGSVQGVDAHDAAITADPVLAGFAARTTDPAAVSAAGDAVRGIADTLGKQVVLLGAVHDRHVRGSTNYTTSSAANVIAAAGAGVRIAVMSILVTNAHASVSTKVTIRTGTTARIVGYAKAAGGGFAINGGGVPLFIGNANEAITAICGTTGADVDVTISGYTISN